MYEISKEFHFSASHQLSGLPDDHQCARLHGHNYILTIKLGGSKLDDTGFILDYGQLAFVKQLVDKFDHRHLNDLFDFNPTSENIIRYLWNKVHAGLNLIEADNVEYIVVGLNETPKTYAEFIQWR